MKIVIQINLEPGKVESYDDVVDALKTTAATLSSSSEPLNEMDGEAYIFTNQGDEVGVFTVTANPINSFNLQLS
jgi:hypothetical protein